MALLMETSLVLYQIQSVVYAILKLPMYREPNLILNVLAHLLTISVEQTKCVLLVETMMWKALNAVRCFVVS
jgi:hypothetical protein